MQAATAQAPQGDVVQLSNAAQAKLLKQQGLDVAQIAIKLGLDAKTVATYFPSVGSKG
jgi:DNA-binding CsgD family transcriptional regulator